MQKKREQEREKEKEIYRTKEVRMEKFEVKKQQMKKKNGSKI